MNEIITVYKCSDGSIFDSEAIAKDWEKLLTYEVWYEDNMLFGITGDRVDWRDLLQWLEDNKEKLQDILSLL